MSFDLADSLEKGGRYFMGQDELHDAARHICRLFSDMGFPCAVAGALALTHHGRRRFTEDVDLLVRGDDLRAFKKAWLGLGYVELTKGLKAVRDTARGVKIDFLIAGDYPGDGKPKPIAFPDPATQTSDAQGFRVIDLVTLIELKLASGMTAPHRGQDLSDVQALIAARGLGREHADDLHPYVRAKYLELWELAQIRDDY